MDKEDPLGSGMVGVIVEASSAGSFDVTFDDSRRPQRLNRS
jgi:hypothetical protein